MHNVKLGLWTIGFAMLVAFSIRLFLPDTAEANASSSNVVSQISHSRPTKLLGDDTLARMLERDIADKLNEGYVYQESHYEIVIVDEKTFESMITIYRMNR